MEFKKLSDVEVVAEPAESANVLIEENGVIKKAPKTAVGGAGGGTVEPDMVMLLTGYLSSSSPFNDGTAELSIIDGTPSAIKAKLEAGESPVVKMKHVHGAYGDYSHSRYEYDVYVVTYGEDYWFSTIAISSSGDTLYKVSGGFNADGNITWNSAASIT
jgi:hypothetical protein